MHEAASHDFDPPQPTPIAEIGLDVHLGRWLGEREEGRPESRAPRRAVEAPRKVRERGLEIGKADPLVHREPFDLREHRRVRRVEEIAAIHVAGREDADRRRIFLQGADLHRRRVRPQQSAALEIERVVQLHRGVIRGKVEREEVVPLRLGLRAQRDAEPELAEDLADLVDHERDRVHGAAPVLAGRHAGIADCDGLGRAGEFRAALLEQFLDRDFRRVGELSGRAAVFLGEGPERAHDVREASARAADERIAQIAPRAEVGHRADERRTVRGEGFTFLLELGEGHN